MTGMEIRNEPTEEKQTNDHFAAEKASSESLAELIPANPTLPGIEIPNGGFIAWLHVAGAFCIFLNTWGIINTYGVYQAFYQTDFLRSKSESEISWIGSIQAFLLYIVGAVAGPIFDAGYLRPLIWTGALLSVLGMMLTSISRVYWQVLLAQGMVVGISTGCLFIAAVSIVSQYFTTKKVFAYGITSTGSSIGGVIYPVIFSRIQPRLGFAWATRVIGFVMLALFVVPLISMRQRVRPVTRRRLLNAASFRDSPFLIFNTRVFFGFVGVYVPFYYMQLYALQVCNMDDGFSFYLLAIINASPTVDRVLPSFFADNTGPLNMQIPFTFIASILCFGWIAVRSTSGLILWFITYGFFCGCFASMPSSSVMSMTFDLQTMGSRMGMALAASGFGFLIGSPIGGALLRSQGGLVALQAWVGSLLLKSGFCSLAARTMKVGLKSKVNI